MSLRRSKIAALLFEIFLTPLFLLIIPLGGVWISNRELAPYLEFPPATHFVKHAGFSWPVFILLLLFVVSVCLPIVVKIMRSATPYQERHPFFPFPSWGYLGVGLVFVSWALAWSRFSWFSALQPYTFFPLWFGFIITANAWSYRRKGKCLMISEALFFWILFPVSALFWWFFEYLNRFSQNWHYLGIENFSPEAYVMHATLCFSTVLPAVLSTEELLRTVPALRAFRQFHAVDIKTPILSGIALLVVSSIGLAAVPLYPDIFFPLLWIAPFLIIISIQIILGEKTLLAPIRDGNWRSVCLPALAALICGFFWEMWNYKSFAHWQYSVPFVQRFHLFEMPVLGYAGYLPFGLECAVVAGIVRDFLLFCRGKGGHCEKGIA